ncbi:hypothetical protein E3Q22_03463 [Wallemia mellicola]|uniref:Uncharacterized protein n=1 Tax=Wallemia mellicola TaxID=1708541 RepID=A0A4T0T602_9BASI|nr:hypothetical protein E3Q22_03463 [Wallemia mellicola]TIC60342.1 hypothetical protein E3Q03_03286 [Wallemia mellicola]
MSSIEATIDLLERLDKNPNDDNFLEALRFLVNLDYNTTVYLTLTQYILNSNHLNYADLLGFFKTLTQAKIQRHLTLNGLLDVLDKLNLRASLKVSYLAGIMMALDSSRNEEIDDIQDILICEIEDSLLYEVDSLLDNSYIKTLVMILPQIRTNKLKLMDINLLRNFFVKVLIESFKLDNHNDNIHQQSKEIKERPLYTSIPSISRILSRFCTLWSHQNTNNLENLLEGLLQISIQHERLLSSFSFSELDKGGYTFSSSD